MDDGNVKQGQEAAGSAPAGNAEDSLRVYLDNEEALDQGLTVVLHLVPDTGEIQLVLSQNGQIVRNPAPLALFSLLQDVQSSLIPPINQQFHLMREQINASARPVIEIASAMPTGSMAGLISPALSRGMKH